MGNWISFVDWCSLRNCGVCWRSKAAYWESVPLSAFGVRLAVERCCTYNILHLVSRTIHDLEEFTEEKGRKEARWTHDVHSWPEEHVDAFPARLLAERNASRAHQPPAERRRRVDAAREARHALDESQARRPVLEAN